MTPPTITDMARSMIDAGVKTVHVLAWRDLLDPEAGGSEIHADAFMTRWQEAGLDIVHRTSHASALPEESRRNGYRVVRKGGRFTVFGRVVASELSRSMGPYDAVVEIWNGVPWMSPVWCRRPHLLVLHHVHGPMWDQILPGPLAWIGKKLESSWAPPLYRRTPTVTLCEDSKADLESLGWPSHNITVAHAGVDSYFHPGGDKTSHPSVLAVGRLAPVKRFEDLLNQFERTRGLVPGAELTIVGEGPQRGILENWIQDHEAHEWVHLLGRVSRDDLRDLYRRSWLITSASLAEGWGLTLTEAAGCGTPAVATDIGGHRSSVIHDVTGQLVPLEELGSSCAALLGNDRLRAELGRQALERARTLSWDRLAADVLWPLYRQVMGRAT